MVILDVKMKKSNVARIFILVLCLVFVGTQATASALSAEQKKIYDEGIGYYDTDPGEQCTDGGGTISLSGSDNEQKAYNYFVQNEQLTPIQAAAIVGNLMQESGVNPKSNQAGGPGMGIAQWSSPGRWDNLIKFAGSKDPYDLATQLSFMSAELHGTPPAGDYSGTLNNLKKQTSIEDATGYFMGTSAASKMDPATTSFISAHGKVGGYENPGTPALDNRINDAKSVLQLYGGGAASGLDAGCGAVGAVNCNDTSADATETTGSLSTVRQNAVCIAQQELASWNSGQLKPGTDFYKYTGGAGGGSTQWCAYFMSWVFKQAGYPVTQSGNQMEPAAFGFEHLSTFDWHPSGSGYTPQPGDVVVYSYSHVNMVVSVNGSKHSMTVIGGNQSGNVPGTGTDSKVSSYTINSFSGNSIAGYASPKGN